MIKFLIHLWFFGAAIQLGFLTWQDVTQNRWVDDRRNWYMFGLTTALLTLGRPLYYVLLLIVLAIVLKWFFQKFLQERLGEADTLSLTWLFIGLGYIDPFYWIVYVLCMTVCCGVMLLVKHFILKEEGYVPFYPVLFLSFVGLWALVGL